MCEWSGRLTAFTAVVAPASLAPDETPVVPKDATKLSELVVVTPEEHMGDVVGDLNRRRGIILGMEDITSGKEVSSEVPSLTSLPPLPPCPPSLPPTLPWNRITRPVPLFHLSILE